MPDLQEFLNNPPPAETQGEAANSLAEALQQCLDILENAYMNILDGECTCGHGFRYSEWEVSRKNVSLCLCTIHGRFGGSDTNILKALLEFAQENNL